MKIYGFDKTSLLNYPEHVAATVFTGGCNMRCPYCHNGELVLDPPDDMLIPEEEIIAHLTKRKNVLTGLCITGGEPTLQPDLKQFILKVRALGYKIKLDTNGLRPDILGDLIEEGLIDHVAMDIKAGRDNYPNVTGIIPDMIEKITGSVRQLITSEIEYELRTTVVKGLHTTHDLEDIRDWMKDILREVSDDAVIGHYYLQSYVYRDTILDKTRTFDSFSKEELERFADILAPIAKEVNIRGID